MEVIWARLAITREKISEPMPLFCSTAFTEFFCRDGGLCVVESRSSPCEIQRSLAF